MRQPTPDPLGWWRRALADPSTPRHETEPQAGFYRCRAVKRGPYLPVQITLRQVTDEHGELVEDEKLEAVKLGRAVNPLYVWMSCRPITEDEYHALIERHQSVEAMKATHAQLDLGAMPMLPKGARNV